VRVRESVPGGTRGRQVGSWHTARMNLWTISSSPPMKCTEYSLWTAITSWTILDLAAPNGGSWHRPRTRLIAERDGLVSPRQPRPRSLCRRLGAVPSPIHGLAAFAAGSGHNGLEPVALSPMFGPGLQGRERPTASGCPPTANLPGKGGRQMPPAAPPMGTVEPVACQHIEFVDQNDPVVKPLQRGFWNGADQARPGRFDGERKARCGPDSRRNARGRLRCQGIKRGSKVLGRHDCPGCPGDFGQPLRDIGRFPGLRQSQVVVF
jgi:hypothetical protein